MLDLEREARELKASGKHGDALRLRQEIERGHDRDGVGPVERAVNLNYMAFLAVCVGDLDEAERAARKCLEVYRTASTEKNQKYATYLMMLSCVLAESGKFDEAIRHGEEAVAVFSLLYGEEDSFVKYRERDLRNMRDNRKLEYLDREILVRSPACESLPQRSC